MSESGLVLEGVGKVFGNQEAVSAVSLKAKPGRILGITGPSAAGKTTLCRLISGLEKPSTGDIAAGGRRWNQVPPQQRNVAYMFESNALYPQMSVFDNIAFPLRSPAKRGAFSESDVVKRVHDVTTLTEISGLEHRLPGELSGGQKQRVALCRALVQDPSVFLLDEPISHLDAKLRHKLRGEVRRRQLDRTAPTLWFTPDAMEALSVADDVAVIINGRIQQIGPPDEIYSRPANIEVARLVGDPAINLIRGRILREGEDVKFCCETGTVALATRLARQLDGLRDGDPIVLGIRPNDLVLADGAADAETLSGKVYTVEPFGKYVIITVRIGTDFIKIKSKTATRLDVDETVRIRFPRTDFLVFEDASGRAIGS